MVRVLSFHARYRCQHRGACCTAGWPIPIEPARRATLMPLLASGALAARSADPFGLDGRDGMSLVASDHRGCTFHDAESRRCAVHRTAGHDALPLACRQFPRISLHDPRGVSVTLSHFCPTAAACLDDGADVSISTTAPGFPAGGEYDGLDARTVLPPLLRPNLLMDWNAWWDCEERTVDLLGNSRTPPRQTLARLAAVVDRIQAWTPAAPETLGARVRTAFACAAPAPERLASTEVLLEEARAAIPAGIRPATPPSSARPGDAVIHRFLAAHAFANWVIHGRGGLTGWFRSVQRAYALLDHGFAVRDADLWLRHLASDHDPSIATPLP